MTYDSFARGPAPVGVKTIESRDAADRPLVTEVWYPAVERHRGEDLADATRDEFTITPRMPRARQNAVRDAAPVRARLPLVMYFHGGYGHRRESSNLCTHLASHGYAVAAPDFPGDHIADVMPASLGGNAKVATTPIDDSAVQRPRQAVAALDGLLAAAPQLGLDLEGARVGSTGISMGGYTSLAVNSLDTRFTASFAMCPMYGTRSPLRAIARLQGLLRLDDWRQNPHVFVLASELDSHVMLADLRDLHERLPAPKRFAVLKRAGHIHFADGAEAGHEMYRKAYLSGEFPDPELDAIALGRAMRPFAELVSEADANATARALLLAQMDSVLRGNADAARFLDDGLAATFAQRGIDLEVPRGSSNTPTRDRTLTMPDGRTVGFTEYGAPDGTAVLWCHGGPGSRREPEFLSAAAAQAGLRIIGIDRPGYGLSTMQPGRTIGGWVDDALAVADDLELATFATVGVSTGGAYALAVAARSDRVVAAVACCAVTDMRWPEARATLTSPAPVWNAPTRAAACAAAAVQFGERGEKMNGEIGAMGIPASDAALFAEPGFAACWRESAVEMFAQGVGGYTDDRLADGGGWHSFDSARIACPVVVLHGTADTLVPPAHAQLTQRLVPNARLELRDGLGHFSIMAEIVPALRALLDERRAVRQAS